MAKTGEISDALDFGLPCGSGVPGLLTMEPCSHTGTALRIHRSSSRGHPSSLSLVLRPRNGEILILFMYVTRSAMYGWGGGSNRTRDIHILDPHGSVYVSVQFISKNETVEKKSWFLKTHLGYIERIKVPLFGSDKINCPFQGESPPHPH